ncbi:MAG TPA: hypothetical protein VES19_07390 [Candidatus Limnocylindrales bacterium]|nr:hypothetical protein [Candidatus Limnocylindrales bacterium]
MPDAPAPVAPPAQRAPVALEPASTSPAGAAITPASQPASRRRAGPLLALGGLVVVLGAVGLGAMLLLRPGVSPGGPGQGGSTGTGTASPGTAAGGPPATTGPDATSGVAGPLWTGERTPSPGDAEEGTPGDIPAEPTSPEEGDAPPPETTAPLSGDVALGAPGVPVTATVGAAGGIVTAPGLTIELPAGALAGDTAIAVTTTPIDGLAGPGAYGGAITPGTPLYSVSLGEAALAAPATVTLAMTIPAALPADVAPMAFYRDPATGALSPLTPVSWAPGRLTVLAPHFSDVFGGLVDLARVPATVDSGFRPGKDDWQFANFGSYVAPGGQCEGQTVSEIWYYLRQRGVGASPLWGLYDNNGAPDKTPPLWQDDSEGYRFVGSVHRAGIADLFSYLFLRDTQWDAADSRATMAAFRAAIAFSGSPQMIRISPAPGDAGHTMIVYRVTPSRLYVADPNYPGRLRSIPFDAATGRLATYSSGDSATSIGVAGTTAYTRFAYVPWVASKSEAWVAERWADFEANKAGDRTFPNYELKAVSGKDDAGKSTWAPLVDGFVTTEAKLDIQITKLGDGAASSMLVFRGTSTKATGGWGWKQTLDLDPGENEFGLLVYGKKGDAWAYVDFVRLTIVRGGATVAFEPFEVCPLVGKEYLFNATATGIPPGVKKVGFTWDFGYGPLSAETYAAPFAGALTTQASHTFEDETFAPMRVILSDLGGASPVELARAEVQVQSYEEHGMLWTLCTHEIQP